jgi:hypothetical protein
MPLYRLLRNNKESGPYSLNDIVKLGLKPYDLIWVDGRSAAWRYPSEISELKEYAPTVEEQPFDRFFKKPTSESESKQVSDSTNPANAAPQKTINESFVKNQPAQEIPNSNEELPKVKETTPEIQYPYSTHQPQPIKKVFVSMPETNGFNPNPIQETKSIHEEKYEQYLPKPKVVQQDPSPVNTKPYSPINIQESDETKVETKYSQSLDDIKEMYINTLVQRKTKNKRKEIIKRYVRPALLPLLLVIVGIAIGYFISTRKKSLQSSESISKVVVPQTTPQNKPVVPEQNSEDPIDQQNSSPHENQNSVKPTQNKKQEAVTPSEEKSLNPGENNEDKKITQSRKNNNAASDSKITNPATEEKQAFVRSNKTVSVQKKDVEVDPKTGERKSVVRNNNDVDAGNDTRSNTDRSNGNSDSKRSFLENEHKDIRNLVQVRSNEYIRGTFGGIRGLELTVYNNSNYLLDEVSVELQIMKPSEQPLRTDIITFRNISANTSLTVKVPDSQRGIRVDYRITNIESKQFQKSTAGL